MHRLIALIPARAGSKRVPEKNVRELAGHPLLAYAIATAQESELFMHIVVSTDSPRIARAVEDYGAEVVIRPKAFAEDWSPDIEWVNHAMASVGADFDAFAILRPTSPFRRGGWVREAWEKLRGEPRADSIRAVRPDGAVGKLFACSGEFLLPVAPYQLGVLPWHSMPSQETPIGWRQTAALEMAWARVLPDSISGQIMLRYVSQADAPEACDINEPGDWERAGILARMHPEYLPSLSVPGGVLG